MKSTNFLLLFLCLSGTLLLLNACEEEEMMEEMDPCESVECLNGGTCTDGTCSCPTGFTGTNCETTTGCTDELAVNYDMNAMDDDGSCRYPGDVFVGDWVVTMFVGGAAVDTVMHTSVITKEDNTNILITSTYPTTPVPEYFLNTNPLIVDWEAKVLTRPVSTVGGTITDEDNFEVTYSFSASTAIFEVRLEFRRQ